MTRELLENGIRQLAVSVGEATRGTALTRILALKSATGWLVEGASVREWRFTGVTEQDGKLYLYGPFVSGTMLEEVLSLPLPKALPHLAFLARSLALLSERSIPWFPLQTDAILFTEGGGVLFLPPEIFRELRDLRPFAENLDTFECITHPDLKEEARATFAVAALLYRVITGRFPITGRDAEEVHEQARKLDITPPATIVPGLLPEVSSTVMTGLGRSRGAAVTLSEWAGHMHSWRRRDVYRVLDAQEKELAERESLSVQEGSARGFRRRVFWQKNWKLVAIIAVAVVVAGAVAVSMLQNILAPRVTKGFPPAKVVETFYKSMNTLDHATMQACVVGKAGQAEINETTTLFVTSRVVLAYEGKSNVISAADWDAQGRPDLVSPASLYGATGIRVTQEQGEPTPVFLAKYDRWNPVGPADTGKAPDPNAAPSTEGHAVTDRVFLKQDKGDWVIYRIDRLRADPLPAPNTVAAPPQVQPGGLLPPGQ